MGHVDVSSSTTPVAHRADTGSVSERRARRFSASGLALGTLLFVLSLTPSLLPRSVEFKGTAATVATVAVQYSYLPSPLALLTEAPSGAEAARALFQQLYGHWTRLPKERRPELSQHGVSLGALDSDLSFDLYDVLTRSLSGGALGRPAVPQPVLEPHHDDPRYALPGRATLMTRYDRPGRHDRLATRHHEQHG